MAKIIKSRARAPLAESIPTHSHGENTTTGEHYSIRVSNETHGFTLQMTPNEARAFIGWFAQCETFVYGHESTGGMGWSDKRTLPEKLRALADKIEANV